MSPLCVVGEAPSDGAGECTHPATRQHARSAPPASVLDQNESSDRPTACAVEPTDVHQTAAIKTSGIGARSHKPVGGSPQRRNVFTGVATEVPQGTGSGFVWDDAGHIVTNLHVLQGATKPPRSSCTINQTIEPTIWASS